METWEWYCKVDSGYTLNGTINFHCDENQYLEIPDSLWDCMFIIKLPDYKSEKYSSITLELVDNPIRKHLLHSDILKVKDMYICFVYGEYVETMYGLFPFSETENPFKQD